MDLDTRTMTGEMCVGFRVRTRRVTKSIGPACAWRIHNSWAFLACAATLLGLSVRDLAVLVLHLVATVARVAGPGGARSVVAESVLVKHQC